MILGLGVDILSLARFEAVVARRGLDRVARRICCPRELADFARLSGGAGNGSVSSSTSQQLGGDSMEASSPRVVQRQAERERGEADEQALVRKQLRYLSSRWAIKEAAYKALTPSLPLLRTLVPSFHLSFHSFDLVHQRGIPQLNLLRHAPPVLPAPATSEQDTLRGNVEERSAVLREIALLSTLSHDAGVVVGVVLAQRVNG